jgi:UDP-N-acetylmuramoylalanine--D-glutamate ligase
VKRALVLGLARSGSAAALALRAAGTEVVGVDRDPDVDVGRLRAAGVEIRVGRDDAMLLDEGIEVLVKSPGVPADAPLVTRARELGVPVWSEIELGARILPQPILGVTGTNGKTTTSELLGAIFHSSERPVEVAGNIGRPLTSLVGAVDDDAWIVCELSSFQLEDVHTLRPRVAVLLNLEPDHIDRHGSFASYRDAKLRIFENQEADDVAVVPRGFGAIPGKARRVEFAVDDVLPAEPRIPGAHNRENAAAAVAAARAAGIGDDAIARGLREFPGVLHRLETVASVRGVAYVNDSKATNVAATLRALAAVGRPLHVVLGGKGKHESYVPLATALQADARAYLIGAAATEIAEALTVAGVPHEHCGDLEHAVAAAASAARSGDVVLLSPACASFDQFKSFEDRGDAFRRIVERLEREAR